MAQTALGNSQQMSGKQNERERNFLFPDFAYLFSQVSIVRLHPLSIHVPILCTLLLSALPLLHHFLWWEVPPFAFRIPHSLLAGLNQWGLRYGGVGWKGERHCFKTVRRAGTWFIVNAWQSLQLRDECLAFNRNTFSSKAITTVLYINFHFLELSHSSASKESAWSAALWDSVHIQRLPYHS